MLGMLEEYHAEKAAKDKKVAEEEEQKKSELSYAQLQHQFNSSTVILDLNRVLILHCLLDCVVDSIFASLVGKFEVHLCQEILREVIGYEIRALNCFHN